MLRENVTMGQVFKDNGYATDTESGISATTILTGPKIAVLPRMRHGGGGVGQTPDYWDNAYFDGSYWHNGKPEAVKGFCTDVFFRYARISSRPRSRPENHFSLTSPPMLPMGLSSPEEFSEPYQDQNVNLANFYGMIANIDQNVGQLRSSEEEAWQTTPFSYLQPTTALPRETAFLIPECVEKGSEYDGGHRVPLFVRWPNGDLSGGRDVGAITAYVDVLPTLIDLCDVKSPSNVKFDGVSITPLLSGKPPRNWRIDSGHRLATGERSYQVAEEPLS